jgi:heme/copper-type cytochrome/quinol oxidase subunit 2
LNTRILLALGAVVAAVVLFFLLRPEDGDDDAAATATTGATTTNETTTNETTTSDTATETETETDATTTAPARPPGTRIAVRVQNGRPVGGVARLTVEQGERVRLIVRSDVADHVHVHGYNLFKDVAPGMPARFSFRATVFGGFEIELEDRHLLLAELQVEP